MSSHYTTLWRRELHRLNGSELEGGTNLKVAAIGAFAVFVGTIVASKVGKPLQRGKSEVITDIGLKNVVGAVSVILEVTSLWVKTAPVEPVVGNADVKTTLVIA